MGDRFEKKLNLKEKIEKNKIGKKLKEIERKKIKFLSV